MTLFTKTLAFAPLAVLATVGTRAHLSARPSAPERAEAPARLRYIVAPTGNEARYRVREQLVGVNLPNDAIGVTKDITGRIVLDADGKVVKDSSRIVVLVTSLTSDKPRRDGFLQRRTLETSKFPDVTLVPAAVQGLSLPLAAAPKTFSLVGDLTVHGVTRPTTWQVTAKAEGKDVVGSAVTAFTFKDFGLEQPRVPVVLSVADTIKLEYDFHVVPDTAR